MAELGKEPEVQAERSPEAIIEGVDEVRQVLDAARKQYWDYLRSLSDTEILALVKELSLTEPVPKAGPHASPLIMESELARIIAERKLGENQSWLNNSLAIDEYARTLHAMWRGDIPSGVAELEKTSEYIERRARFAESEAARRALIAMDTFGD